MIRIVLDTNVVVSALLNPDRARNILKLILERRARHFSSIDILQELRTVLSRAQFRLNREQVDAFILEWEEISQMVSVDLKIQEICRDSDDHIILECAVKSKADFIVTGDADLLVLNEFLGTRIVTPAGFLTIFTEEH